MQTKTNLKMKQILPDDRNKTDTVIVNEPSMNSNNKGTDILESAQGSNTKLINESGMVQDSKLPKIII